MSCTHLGGGTDIGRRENEAHCSKVSKRLSKSGDVDVFKEHEPRLAFSNDSGDFGPDVPRVFLFFEFPCQRERLTREASRDDIHEAAPR
jgi:hypothetical protein